MTDVLVIGAGPAGSAAAMVLARIGVSVRIIDRASFPRDKLCGDTLNPGTVSIVRRLAGPAVHDQLERRALHISGMVVTGPRGARVAGDYPHGLHGLAITRHDLDACLLDVAMGAGAEFHPGVAARAPMLSDEGARVVGVRTTAGDMRARIVIAAEGRQARLAVALGLSRFAPAPKRWAFGAYFADVAAVGARGEMHVGAGRYIGVAPVPGGLANVCVVGELSAFGVRDAAPHARNRDGRSLTAGSVIADAIDADPILRQRFAGSRRVSQPTTLGPLAVESIAAGCPGLLLAGDAAGFIDPMTGDGMRFALRGGELAAEAAIRELTTGRPAYASLASTRTAEFGGKWRLNRALRALISSPPAVAAAAALTTCWSMPVRSLIARAGDVPLALRT